MKKINDRNIQFQALLIGVILMIVAGIFNLIRSNIYVALAEFICAAILVLYIVMFIRNKKKDMAEIMSMMSEENANLANDVLTRFPLPMLILSIDGKVVWYNDVSLQMFDTNNLYNYSITELLPELKWTQVLKSTSDIKINIEHNSRHYNVFGSIIKRKDESENKETYSVLLYFNDSTALVNTLNMHEAEKVDVAIVTIDNYDDVFQTMENTKSQETIGKINSVVAKWASESNSVMKKTQSDRFLLFFEHQYLENYIKNKFDILEKIRSIGDEIKEPITISIGIGTGGHLIENEAYARSSVEMVLGRGGDQVAIKDKEEFKFYGGTAKDYEKSTRVKTRIFSNALREMIKQADKVVLMGHKAADYDSFGAAIGLSRAARILDRQVYIVLDNSPAIKTVYEELENMPDYQGMIISPNTAGEIVTEETLVIVLDTHRPSMLPAEQILSLTKKIVLIDHHRRSTEFIDNVSLSYLEPYASSTSEMVTEVLQYIDTNKKMNNFEAKLLYIGMLMDTKNFVTKTGVRTFEAASYLKRYGVNTMEVKKVFNLSYEEYVKRIDIIKKVEIWNTDIAVSVCTESFTNMRVVSSQAADEMLNISGVNAAFVIYPSENEVCFCARSFGDINVQVIMESLGGGGHMTVAGCQIKNITLTEARDRLKEAIKEYIENNK